MYANCFRNFGTTLFHNNKLKHYKLPKNNYGIHPIRTNRKRSKCLVCMFGKNYYQILEIEKNATLKEIKTAFKKKALKLHPDINKESDAQKKFMKVKEAYQTLSDPVAKADYDNKLSSNPDNFFDSWMSSHKSKSSSTTSDKRKTTYNTTTTSEPEFNMDDFFRDIGNEYKTYTDSKRKLDGSFKSLWEEMQDLGNEFVEFLEQELGMSGEEESKVKESEEKAANNGKESDEIAKKSKEEIEKEIEETLNSMKKDLGL